ncbi:ATP-binding protein [Vibrio sp. 1180_3]|uniref:ATP-binding protein n=1 Tax=Vibrio sp. 1180_3 TaxID=2528832 RepID=UPI00240720F4|nr:ATP-binding protein [Vibrio sp. 1180_3]MDF9399591.1 response regulator [Vibrio sp. 1180_3]
MSTDGPLERKLLREIAARKEAEKLLEQKSYDLYQLNQRLDLALKQLEIKSLRDLRKFEFEEQIDETLIYFGRAFLSRTLDDTLLAMFIKRLSESSVIESTYLQFSHSILPTLSCLELGNDQLKTIDSEQHDISWQQDNLYVPIIVERQYVGRLIFEVKFDSVERDFIINQMALVGELLCSAISRQLIMTRHIESRKRAEESEKSTKEFVAMINHELRTPLNGLLGSAELLADTPLNREQCDYLANLKHSGDMLRIIINDLLDFSKMNAGMMQLIPTQFHWNVFEQALVGILMPKAQEKRLSFVIEKQSDFPQWWVGDVERLKQVLVNLIGNAIKFTHQGEVRLTLKWVNKQLNIIVSDTGVGIPKSAHANLFDPFMQADRSSKRNFEGTGLGLAICKSLVELMEGELWFESEQGEGSQFFITLPLQTCSGQMLLESVTQASEHAIPLSSRSILVVDDIRMNQIIINQMLKMLNIQPDITTNGVEAVDAAQRNTYDLIFMDCRMPEMDGFEATQLLREKGYSIPIIALTAGTTLEERERCLQCGMDDILTKPYTANDLERMLIKWLC